MEDLRRIRSQSLDEDAERAVFDEFVGYCLAAATFWVVAVLEWIARALDLPRLPEIYVLAAVVSTALVTWKWFSTRRQLQLLRQGRDGERAVAELLDDLRREGAQVLHDIPDHEGSADLVVICRQGIFVIEIKAWSKPDNVWSLDFDGERVHIATRIPTPGPIAQCRAETSSIRGLLRDSTSRILPVRGVVLFLDWFVKRGPGARGSDIWVLNPNELAGWIRREAQILSDAEVAMATSHLKHYVRLAA